MNRSLGLGGFKMFLGSFGVVCAIVAILMAIAVPSRRAWEQSNSIFTYERQVMQAATAAQFAAAMRGLDQALQDAGMIRGTTKVPWAPRTPDLDMAFKRASIKTLALVAEQLTVFDVASIEASTGLLHLKATFKEIPVGAYGFWVWNQGGSWTAVYIPFLLFFIGVVGVVVAISLPDFFRFRSRPSRSPA